MISNSARTCQLETAAAEVTCTWVHRLGWVLMSRLAAAQGVCDAHAWGPCVRAAGPATCCQPACAGAEHHQPSDLPDLRPARYAQLGNASGPPCSLLMDVPTLCPHCQDPEPNEVQPSMLASYHAVMLSALNADGLCVSCWWQGSRSCCGLRCRPPCHAWRCPSASRHTPRTLRPRSQQQKWLLASSAPHRRPMRPLPRSGQVMPCCMLVGEQPSPVQIAALF